MTSFQFLTIVKLFSILIRAIIWKKDPGNKLQEELAKVEVNAENYG